MVGEPFQPNPVPGNHEPELSIAADPSDAAPETSLPGPPPRPGLIGTIDGYEVIQIIGRGGMGIVGLCRDPADQDLVAIKLMRPELARHRQFVQRFLLEAQHMSRLVHAHILPVLRVGERVDAPYFVMPYMSHGSLAKLIEPGKPLEAEAAVRIAIGIAEALSFAHDHGITHRDLKPGNVLIDADDNAVLTDFGLSKTVFNDAVIDVTQPHREGTAAYMAPEIARGSAGDTRCDIYSFGAVLYEMLTGRPPYEGQTTAELITKITRSEPAPVLRWNPHAPVGLTRIAEGAMARDLAERYATMEHVLCDLRRVAEGRDVLGPHGNRKSSALTPRRLLAVAAGSAAVVAIALFGASAWMSNHANQVQAVSVSATTSQSVVPGPSLKCVRTLLSPGAFILGQVFVGDHTGLGEKDICYLLPDGRTVAIMSGNAQQMLGFSVGEPGASAPVLCMVANGDEYPDDEVFVAWSEKEKLTLRMYNRHGAHRQWEAEGGVVHKHTDSVENTFYSGIMPSAIVDLDADGNKELIATINTAFGGPRAICCYGLVDQKLRWRHEIGPNPYRFPPQVLDLDGDGMLELLAGSCAPCNNVKGADGTQDDHSYVFAFKHDGTLLWATPLIGGFSGASPLVANLDGDGKREIYAWTETSPDVGDAEGQIVQLDSAGKVLARFAPKAHFRSCLPADIDNDGKPELIATDCDGRVLVLGPGLRLKKKQQVVVPEPGHSAVLILQDVADLDADGQPELVLSSMQRQVARGNGVGAPGDEGRVVYCTNVEVLILTPKLDIVARYRVAERWKQLETFKVYSGVFDDSTKNRLLMVSNRVELLDYTVR